MDDLLRQFHLTGFSSYLQERKKMQEKNFKTKASVVSYDLHPNTISAEEIAEASQKRLFTKIKVDGVSFELPNSTLWADNADPVGIINIFNESLLVANRKRLILNRVKRLVAIEASNGFIQNN